MSVWRMGHGSWGMVAAAVAATVGGCAKRAVAPAQPVTLVASAGYRPAVAGWTYVFPRDHGSHPAFATEWWYYTGHLRNDAGRTYGYELTFFRVGVSPHGENRKSAWAVRDVYMAHLAVTDEATGTFAYFDELSRGSLGDASAAVGRLAVHLGTWSAREKDGAVLLKGVRNGYGVEISAVPIKPPAIHGEEGISRKGPGVGEASHYYSLTRMKTVGRVCIAGKWTDVQGESWFDHEFGSAALSAAQVGWDWFGLQMDDGTEAMLYLMRGTNGKPDGYSSGTLIDASGKTIHLKVGDFHVETLAHWHSDASGANYPSKWRIRIPQTGWDVTVEPTVADQELRTARSTGVTYYEGSASVLGRVWDKPASGKAYVELTGYGG